MADLKEVKSRIRIKRGPKTKMSGVTLPEGTPFYNETDNTLLISDGVTELNKHPIITTDSIHTDNWIVEEVNDTVRGLNALKIQKNNNVPIYIINDGGGYPADATVISPEYLRANEVVIGSKSLSINQDNKLCVDGTPIVIKKELFSGTFGGTNSNPGSLTLEDVTYTDTLEIWLKWTGDIDTAISSDSFHDKKVLTCKGIDVIQVFSNSISKTTNVLTTITSKLAQANLSILDAGNNTSGEPQVTLSYINLALLKTEQTTNGGNTTIELKYYDSGLIYPVITKIYKVIQ